MQRLLAEMVMAGVDVVHAQAGFQEHLAVPNLPTVKEPQNVVQFMMQTYNSVELLEKYCGRVAQARMSTRHFE